MPQNSDRIIAQHTYIIHRHGCYSCVDSTCTLTRHTNKCTMVVRKTCERDSKKKIGITNVKTLKLGVKCKYVKAYVDACLHES